MKTPFFDFKLNTLVEKFLKKAPKAVAPPTEELVYIGRHGDEPIRISVIDYHAGHFEEKNVEKIEDVFLYHTAASTSWINIEGVHDVSLIEKLGDAYGVHPLVLEDIVHTNQRPKAEDHDTYLYLVLKMIRFDEEGKEVMDEQVSLLLGDGFLLSLQEKQGDVFGPLRQRIKTEKWRKRDFGADYLAYALVDAIVDHYFVVLEKLGSKIEDLEEELGQNATSESLARIYSLKREMIFIKKTVWPLREVVNELCRTDSSLIADTTKPYLKDVYDHTIQVVEIIESYRDMISGLLDLYMSMISNRMNEVMKVLTIIATIFIPPTFIAGIYGMNFDNMPELHDPKGYFFALCVMGFCIVGMLFYFKRKRWL